MAKTKTRATRSIGSTSTKSSSSQYEKIQNIVVTSEPDSDFDEAPVTPPLPAPKRQAPPPTPRKTASTGRPLYKKGRYSSSYQIQSEDEEESVLSSPNRSPTPQFIKPSRGQQRLIDSVQLSDHEEDEEEHEEMVSAKYKPRTQAISNNNNSAKPAVANRRRGRQTPELLLDNIPSNPVMESSASKKRAASYPQSHRARVNNRRVRIPWNELEFKALRDGMVVYQTSWTQIKADDRWSSILKHRTIVDLKDKARAEKRARVKMYGTDPVRLGIFAIASHGGSEGAAKYNNH